jgi:hypothetical protein
MAVVGEHWCRGVGHGEAEHGEPRRRRGTPVARGAGLPCLGGRRAGRGGVDKQVGDEYRKLIPIRRKIARPLQSPSVSRRLP